MQKFALFALALAISSPALAEPVGRWLSGFGQGTFEYGIKNDSVGSDEVYIACAEDNTYISFTVGGVSPRQGSNIIMTIGPDEFVVMAGKNGYFQTASHVDADNFHALWDAMRAGQNLRVRLSTGQSTNFTLKGAAKVLPKAPCKTDFAR